MMYKSKNLFKLTCLTLAAACLLASCAPGASPTAPAAPTAAPPTRTAQPAATATASPTAITTFTTTFTALPGATLTEQPTLTPTLDTVAQVLPGWNAYCRKGPGTFYFAVTFLKSGNAYPIVGRDGRDVWWQVQVTPDIRCWEGDPTSILQGPVESAPLVLAPPLPSSPGSFDNSSHCDPAKNIMTVWLTWTRSQGATGYNIYLNGSLIAQLAGQKTNSYTDNPPRGVDLKYQIEAFNDYGVSPHQTTRVSACV